MPRRRALPALRPGGSIPPDGDRVADRWPHEGGRLNCAHGTVGRIRSRYRCFDQANVLGTEAHPAILVIGRNRFAERELHRPARDAAGGADSGGQEIGLAQEGRAEKRGRPVVNLARRPLLHHLAKVHQHHLVTHHERLGLVMGNVDERRSNPALDLTQFDLHGLAQLEVEGGQRLVQEEHRRLGHQRTSQRDPLRLSARKLLNGALTVTGELHEVQNVLDPALDLGARHFPESQGKGDIFEHRLVREQGIPLKHEIDRPFVRRGLRNVHSVDRDRARVLILETGDDPKQRGLAASRRAEDRDEAAGWKVQRHAGQGVGVAEALLHIAHLDRCRGGGLHHCRRHLFDAVAGKGHSVGAGGYSAACRVRFMVNSRR